MSQVLYVAPNPTDGVTTYQNVRIERAPDAGGVAGTFAEVANIVIDNTNTQTTYTDLGGSTNSWYRHRWANTAGTSFSDYSTPIIAGDYLFKQWCKADIPDVDLQDSDWDRWRDMALLDLAVLGLGRPAAAQTITPSDWTTDFFSLNGEIKVVTRVDIYVFNSYVTNLSGWEQRGRQLRLFRPNPTFTYKVYGIGEIRNIADIDDQVYMLLYWGIRLKYLDKRIAERANWWKFDVSDKVSDVDTAKLLSLKADAKAEYASRLSNLSRHDAIPIYAQ